MYQRKEQRVCIKVCANFGKSFTETLTMIQQAFGDQSLSRARVFQWHARFKTGRTSVDDDERTWRPTSCTTPETVTRIQELLRQDRRRTVHDIAEEVGIGYGTCQRVLTEELGMHRVTAKFVPRILTADQKEQRVNVCAELRQLTSDDETFLSRVITCDESWVCGYDSETKQQSSQWKSPTSPRPKKIRQVKSNVKGMIITFFDVKGIVHKEFVPTGQSVNSGFCCDILRRLRANVRRPLPKLRREQTWLLHHDNAPSHTSVLTQQFLAKNKISVIPHPPYSPDLAPCDFFLFPKMKLKLKGRRFGTTEEIQAYKNGRDGGTGVYMREGTTSRVTVADRPYGEFYDFYSVSLENFEYHLVLLHHHNALRFFSHILVFHVAEYNTFCSC